MSPMSRPDPFRATQDAHFAAADVEHFRWTTADPAFAPVEDALLAPTLDVLPFPCLEMGCGEGGNLARLARRGHPVGIDRYAPKLSFAARAVPGARLATADATALPFADGTFAGVLIRDLLHHLPAPRRATAEAVRVLRPGGVLVVLEPNGRNPFVALQTRLVAAEAQAREFTPDSVRALLDGLPVGDVVAGVAQGFPLRRLLLHHKFGWPALGRGPRGAAVLAWAERLGERLVPRSRWSYTTLRARRR